MRPLRNFLRDITEVLGTEDVDGIVVAGDRVGHGEWHREDQMFPIQTWDEVAPTFDYDYDNGFGGADCHFFYLWTTTRIIYVDEYDGSTRIASMPRNPTPCSPEVY
jgi:hypothetical protein